MGYEILKAKTKEDVRGMFNVQIQTWMDTYSHPEKGLTEEMIKNHLEVNLDEKIEKRYKNLNTPTYQNWIAKNEDGKVIAWLGCAKNLETKIGGFAIYVLPKFQKRGIGTELLNKGFAWLSDMDKIEIGVEKYNRNVIELYEKMGFEFTGETEDLEVGDFVGKGWILKMEKTKIAEVVDRIRDYEKRGFYFHGSQDNKIEVLEPRLAQDLNPEVAFNNDKAIYASRDPLACCSFAIPKPDGSWSFDGRNVKFPKEWKKYFEKTSNMGTLYVLPPNSFIQTKDWQAKSKEKVKPIDRIPVSLETFLSLGGEIIWMD